MTMSRWKLLAGVFGLSVCGLAALAEPACRTAGHGGSRQLPPVADAKPKTETGGTALPPPLDISVPKPNEVKPAPVPVPLPALPAAKPSEPVPTPLLEKPLELALPMLKDDKSTAVGLPALPAPTSPTPNVPGTTAVPEPTPLPLPGLPAVTDAKGPTLPVEMKPAGKSPSELPPFPSAVPTSGSTQASPITPLAQPSLPLPTPADNKTTLPSLPTSGNHNLPLTGAPSPAPILPGSSPDVRPAEARGVTPTVEKRLKVTLLMGEGNPRFEIRDGEEVVLKVTSDKIDVKAPTEKGDLWSTLKASGRVRFQSPGGDGFCDELQIIPGTCEVIATGKVQFKYNWGKVETAVTSERMTFRLGATPGGQ